MKPTPEMIALGRACLGVNFNKDIDLLVERIYETMDNKRPPIPMILYCPVKTCGAQHIDEPEPETVICTPKGHPIGIVERWDNPPHRSHLCATCGHIWRPSDEFTTGVKAIQTKGANDD